MTAEQNPTEDFTSASPGAMLKEARTEAKLSLEHVASELRMTPQKVRAIEDDDFSRLPTQTFVRGYLRSYAKLVNLDPDEVLAAYRQALIEAGLKDDSEESPLEFNISRPRRSLWHFGIWVLILLAALWLGSLWFVNNQPSISEGLGSRPASESGVAAQAQPNEIAATEAEGENDSALAQPAETDMNEAGAPAVESEAEQTEFVPLAETGTQEPADSLASAETSEPKVQVTPMASVAEVSEQGLDRLQLSFTEECWLVVTDARGDVLHTDLMQPGQSLSLAGVAPFEVKLGNAQAAQLTLNGEPVDFKPSPDARLMTLAVGD